MKEPDLIGHIERIKLEVEAQVKELQGQEGSQPLKILGQRKRKKANADAADAPGTVERENKQVKVEIQPDGVQVRQLLLSKKKRRRKKR